ncbi:hypothetical protein [Muriicola soli]|uniref:Uncharacterized protein n=1 Tax=Muriicola soli TaxID=2507538 RepID=A0A411EAP4_9FLAO|nr:hypothetical protein [Muriicola soli]MBT8281113.1 hypothetical protein [Muriicola sp.]MBT8282630.1 hypothetical protein [Muriicola sp.]NNK11387.1 hypothetical protein [Flavobacteriaceae bacterium]QBA64796.1 hypothetical protein EQY75_09815 [Muriicola soli]
MDLLKRAETFENLKMSHMSTSDRVQASRDAKAIILGLNEVYKKTKDPELMDLMKRLTEKKQKIEKRIKGKPVI